MLKQQAGSELAGIVPAAHGRFGVDGSDLIESIFLAWHEGSLLPRVLQPSLRSNGMN
jgi:hypothetical protein